uniref:putative Ig domain-containing protein n=1 Tax=uncultured Streptococcus sp. TaxID=83427 RepID=UPI0028D78C6E
MKKVEQQQIYSIRKNKAYGASSVLIGIMGTALLLGGLAPAVQAEETDAKPKPEPKPVDESAVNGTNAPTVETEHLIIASQPNASDPKPEPKPADKPELKEDNAPTNETKPLDSTPAQPKEEIVAPASVHAEAKPSEETTPSKRAVSIVYKVRYVDRKSHKVVHEVTKTKTVETTEAKAKASVTENGAELANNSQLENYNVPEGNPTTMTKEIVEGADNIFEYEVEGFGEAETPKERTAALKDTVEYVDKKSGLVLASEEKEETVSTTETVAKEELKIRYSNTMIEIKALKAEAEQLLKKVRPSESSKAGLQATYQLAKQEEAAAQALLSKENVTKAELQSNLERLETVVERLYSELKANGHSGEVRYMLGTETATNEAPYMTIERYFGSESYRNLSDYSIAKDGSTIEVKYKIGLTNITSDELELTPDAKRLGFRYNEGGKDDRYLIKTLTLNNTIQNGTYTIGLQSKKNPNIKITANLKIMEPPLYKIVENNARVYGASSGTGMNGLMGDSVTYDEYTSTAYMTVTPFGYYLYGNRSMTIKDANPDTPQYSSNLWLSLPYTNIHYEGNSLKAPVTITKFEQTGGSPGVKVEFIEDKTPNRSNIYVSGTIITSSDILTGDKITVSNPSTDLRDDVNLSPYRINFKSLPAKAGTYYVDFNITDNIGRVTRYHLNLVTREISQTTITSDSGNEYSNYTLTNADVMLDADKLYRVTNPIPVAVPISDKEQNLGNLVLNKANATLTIDSKPDGVEIVRDTEDLTKFKIIKQNGHTLTAGVHTITATAKDGHFGANVPARTYKFEVMDGLNPISNQSWQEGQAIPTIPVSMTNGSKITSLSVESDGEHLYLSPNADNTGLTGYALKRTDAPQTAIVTATYTNNEGQSRQIKTSFTYTVTPPPVSDLTLSVTNDKQTVSEGTKFADMVVTATEGATVTVGTLPAGVSYDAEHKVLSGTGQYEGRHFISVTATKDNKSITKLVDLTVTPGNFSVPTANYTFTAGEAIPPITLKIPKNATVSYTGGSLPNGLNWSADNKTITGTPTQVGTFTVYGSVNRRTASGSVQSATATINITVNSVPLNFSIPDNTKTVKVLDELPPIRLQADGAVLSIVSGSLPPGVNYDAATKTVSGTPTKVGTYTATFTATSPTISGNKTASATLTINVTPRDLSVNVTNKEQEKTVLTAIDNVVLTPSDSKARLEVDISKLPPGATYDSATRTISGSPSKVGEYLIPYKATYTEMGDASPVAAGNIKINVRALPVTIGVTENNQTVRVGETIKNMVVSHSEHSDLGARYLSVDLPETDLDSYLESTAGLHYDSANRTISGTPTKPGVYKVRLKATLDSETLGRGSAEEIITVTVVDDSVSDPLSLDIKNARQMIALGKSIRSITFTVPDGATLNVDTTKLPGGVSYDESTKTISGTPTVDGSFDIPVTATKAGKSITKDITIDVVDLTPPTSTVNGKDGETPKVKVDRNEERKETTVTFYSDKNMNNQFDEGTDTVLGTTIIKDGQDGAAGANGHDGRDGKDLLNGTENPNPTDGKDGDKYVNTTTGDVFVKENGTWTPAGNIKGR